MIFVCRGQDANLFLVDGKTSIRVMMNVWKFGLHARSNSKMQTAFFLEVHHCVLCLAAQ